MRVICGLSLLEHRPGAEEDPEDPLKIATGGHLNVTDWNLNATDGHKKRIIPSVLSFFNMIVSKS